MSVGQKQKVSKEFYDNFKASDLIIWFDGLIWFEQFFVIYFLLEKSFMFFIFL